MGALSWRERWWREGGRARMFLWVVCNYTLRSTWKQLGYSQTTLRVPPTCTYIVSTGHGYSILRTLGMVLSNWNHFFTTTHAVKVNIYFVGTCPSFEIIPTHTHTHTQKEEQSNTKARTPRILVRVRNSQVYKGLLPHCGDSIQSGYTWVPAW